MQASIVSTSRSPPPPLADVARASLGERVAQAAPFLYCFQIHSRTNFSVSVFHARFHVSHFSTSPSDRKASPSSVDTASQRCARFLDNKQVSQAEILENAFLIMKKEEMQEIRPRFFCDFIFFQVFAFFIMKKGGNAGNPASFFLRLHFFKFFREFRRKIKDFIRFR